MSRSELDMLCHRHAQQGPHPYQADEGGRIKIMLTQENSHKAGKAQHGTPPDHKGTTENTHHAHDEPVETGGSHEHDGHEHEHGQGTSANSEDDAASHSHEKGEHSSEHDVSEHTPA